MFLKILKKTLVKSQLLGYGIALFFGVTIVLVSIQFYVDVKPIFREDSSVFANNLMIINKKVSVLKSMNKERLYFTTSEIEEIKNKSFIKTVSKFQVANYRVSAFSSKLNDFPMFQTELFFESVPSKFLNQNNKKWNWDSTINFIPIIIPESYVKLYNFGFAESQGLPVVSNNMLSRVEFTIKISNAYSSKNFKSKIVGFSDKINSILVPQEFMKWANEKYGREQKENTSRLLLEFKNPNDESILAYFKEHNYAINKEKLEFNKLLFFFRFLFIGLFIIALVIVVLAVFSVLLSLDLILQKNKTILLNLYHLGYELKRISMFYKKVVVLITVVSVAISFLLVYVFRLYYLSKLKLAFNMEDTNNYLWLLSIVVVFLVLFIYFIFLKKKMKKIVL